MGPTEEVRDTEVAHAFATFYRAHYGAVLAFAVRRIDDQETAREIALDVFRIAWRSFSRGGAQPTRAWLLRVARNRIGDAYRSRQRDERLRRALELGASLVATAPDERVHDVLASLPENSREVLMLTYWDGLPAAEVGRVLGCSTTAVWARLHRARAAFIEAWTEEP